MKNAILIIFLAIILTSCTNPVEPTTTDLYGIWEGTEVSNKANPDSTYLYCEFDGTNATITGQAIFEANRFLMQNGDFNNLRYYRSGQITGEYTYPNLKFDFKGDLNIVYSYSGVVNADLTVITGTMKIHDIKYQNQKDTTFDCSITIKKKTTN